MPFVDSISFVSPLLTFYSRTLTEKWQSSSNVPIMKHSSELFAKVTSDMKQKRWSEKGIHDQTKQASLRLVLIKHVNMMRVKSLRGCCIAL